MTDHIPARGASYRPVGPGDHVFLVDGSSFVFRAYFQSIRQDPKYNYRADRLPSGAVYSSSNSSGSKKSSWIVDSCQVRPMASLACTETLGP